MSNYRVILFMMCFLSCSVFAQDKKALRDSIETINKAIAISPDSTDLHLRKAALYVELDDWNYALDEYTIVLNHYPDNLAALFYRGFVHERLMHYAMARNDYQHFLRIVPKDFNTQLCLALLNDKDGRKTEAYDQINTLIEMFPDSAVAYAARADMMEQRGMLEAAIYDYTAALDRDPDNMGYLQARFDLYTRTGEERKARADRDKLSLLYMLKHQE